MAAVLRGQYLVNNVGVCTFCHTPLRPDGSRDNTRFLGGDPCLADVAPDDPESGCLPSRNLTPHETGLKNKTDEDIKRALREGIRTDGANLHVAMPSWLFRNMTDDDLSAIVAYLRSIPPVDALIPPRQPPWNDVPQPIPPVDPETIPRPRADYPERERAERGRYLAGIAGLCIDCHTPDDPEGRLLIDRSRFFQGGRVFPAVALGLQVPPHPEIVHTANITPDVETGVGAYTVAEIVSTFRTGKDREGHYLCAAAHGGPNTPYAGLTDTDAQDIAHYILSIPPVSAPEPSQCTAIQ
jgi:mono/diheme cytochrome c family protein